MCSNRCVRRHNDSCTPNTHTKDTQFELKPIRNHHSYSHNLVHSIALDFISLRSRIKMLQTYEIFDIILMQKQEAAIVWIECTVSTTIDSNAWK